MLERAVTLFDARYTLRALRSIASLRRKLTPEILAKVINEYYPAGHQSRAFLLGQIGQSEPAMEVEGAEADASKVLHEVDIYLHLLVQVYLLDQKNYEQGAKFSAHLVEKVHKLNRRTLDSLASKVYFYFARFYELLPAPAIVSIRPQLLASLRTATLRKDIDLQATLITLLLRNYLQTSDITQADHLVNKTKFPESAANNLIARYNYYLGKIKAIQLDYSGAHEQLVSAIRKAPQTPAAVGFLQAANKLNIIVELLMGDIPDRAIFRDPRLQKALHPYFLLVKAVRVGELEPFFSTLQANSDTFKKDGLYSLVYRLRQNVIKTGIRMMSLTYSRISLRDICLRLGLESEESAEYIVAKAIRDGVIEATLDHEKGYMQSKEILDVYATQEPQEVFHSRISFCMSLHNDSVKA
jgi:26S proteasome regulatory subunit N3